MSEFDLPIRNRGRTLIIVEGNHEKNILFNMLFKCFPELGITPENVWIYGTNIYVLFHELEKEYGIDWDRQEVDLPFIVAKKQSLQIKPRKTDFTNIILVFDYERHDPFFDEEKIVRMQEYFSDPADMGQLYINYPMVESYCHFECFPDNDFKELRVSASMHRGIEYKTMVRRTLVTRTMNFPFVLEKALREVLGLSDETIRTNFVNELLMCNSDADLNAITRRIISCIDDPTCAKTSEYALPAALGKCKYAKIGLSYWEYVKKMFIEIIRHNICKANYVVGNTYYLSPEEYRETYRMMSLREVLDHQNIVSDNTEKGFIWVLNTCVFFVTDYNFSLIEPEQ